MLDTTKLTALLFALGLGLTMTACSSDGGSSDSDDKEVDVDSDEAVVAAARAAWPEYTGDLDDEIDLSAYNVVTIVPFVNLTDNSQEEEAGEEFADEVEDYLTDRYEDEFTTIRVADTALGQADEVVLRGHVYDYSSFGYNPWSGRSKAKFKAEMLLENGQTGELLKSARIKEDSYSENRDELLEDAAKDVARLIGKSKG